MPSQESHSSCYSSSGSSTSSLSSPRLPSLTDSVQQQQQQQPPPLPLPHPPMRIPSTATAKTSLTPSHGCVTRYKTELCRPFTETGKCKYGDKCQFSHGLKELRIPMRHPKYKTEYCRTFHTTGYCPYGPRCHFIHDIHEARTAINPNEPGTVRRHSDGRTPHSAPKSNPRNRMNSDYPTYSDQSHPPPSKFPFSFDELNQALLSYETGDVFQGHEQAQIYPSIFSALPDTFTRRTCSSSSSSNSSLIPQYI